MAIVKFSYIDEENKEITCSVTDIVSEEDELCDMVEVFQRFLTGIGYRQQTAETIEQIHWYGSNRTPACDLLINACWVNVTLLDRFEVKPAYWDGSHFIYCNPATGERYIIDDTIYSWSYMVDSDQGVRSRRNTLFVQNEEKNSKY